jgi:ParB-like chromosome segregation protein Spo0J
VQYRHIEVSTESLRPNPWNTNRVDPENEAKLDESLRRLGVFKPILARETAEGLEILGGQHRWESARRIGVSKIPVVNLGAIDDKTAKEIGLADNARFGTDDADGLARLLRELGDQSDISSFLPYSEKELDVIFKHDDLDLDSLDIDEDEDLELRPTTTKSAPTSQVMRFRVLNEDAERISALIQATIKGQGLKDSDQLTNAGDALVLLLKGHFV